MAVEAEAFVILGQVVGAAVVIGAPAFGIWKWLDHKFDGKADKAAMEDSIKEVKDEAGRHRDYIAKLFDKLEEHSRRDEELAREVLGTMSNNHVELLRELGKKADRSDR